MSQRPTRLLHSLVYACIPPFFALLLALVCVMPKQALGLSYFAPPLVLAPLFFWGLEHPRDMPYGFVFALGLLVDAVEGQPMGFSSLYFLLFFVAVAALRRYAVQEGFVVKWASFGLLALVFSLLGWLVFGLLHDRFTPVLPVVLQAGLAVCIYPLLHRLFVGWQGYATQRRRQLALGR